MNSTEPLNNMDNLIEKLEECQSCYTNALNFETSKNKEMKQFYEEKGLVIPNYGVSNLINKHIEDILILITKANNLKEKVESPIVKISLFGRVSVGKSRLLNALFYQDLFKSGVAHTTSCFVRISKSENNFHKLNLGEGNNIELSMEDLKTKLRQISTNISLDTQLDSNKCVDVYLNINNNKILRENIQIVEIPGSSRTDLVTKIIEKQSLDADIFIFVITNTLNDQERSFFQYQSKLSTKPDIFILVNKWDETDKNDEEETKKNQKTISEELIDLLTIESKLSREEAMRRIYFISSDEIFQKRVKGINERTSQSRTTRDEEFEKFENDISNYIDNPEENKYNRNRVEFKQIENKLRNNISNFVTEIKIKKASQYGIKNKIEDGINDFYDSYCQFIENIKHKLERKSTEINEKLTNFTNKLNENNITETSDEMSKYFDDMGKEFLESDKQLTKQLEEIVNIYKKAIENCKMKYKIYQPNALNVQDTNRNLQNCSKISLSSYLRSIPGMVINIPVTVITNLFGSFVSIFDKAGLAIFKGGKNARNFLVPVFKERSELQCILTNNREKINTINKEITTKIKLHIINIETNLDKDLKEMEEILNYRNDYITNYWIKMDKFINTSENISNDLAWSSTISQELESTCNDEDNKNIYKDYDEIIYIEFPRNQCITK